MRLAGRYDAVGTIRPTKAGYAAPGGPTRSERQAAGRAGTATRVVADQPLWLDIGNSDPSQPEHRRPGAPRRCPRRASAATAGARMGRAAPQRRRHKRTRVAPDRQRPKRPLSCSTAGPLPFVPPRADIRRALLNLRRAQARLRCALIRGESTGEGSARHEREDRRARTICSPKRTP